MMKTWKLTLLLLIAVATLSIGGCCWMRHHGGCNKPCGMKADCVKADCAKVCDKCPQKPACDKQPCSVPAQQ